MKKESLFGRCKFILQVSSIPACTNRYGAKGNGKKIRVRLCLVLALGEERLYAGNKENVKHPTCLWINNNYQEKDSKNFYFILLIINEIFIYNNSSFNRNQKFSWEF